MATVGRGGLHPAGTGTILFIHPAGTVTFLFTDVVGSTALWDADHDAMAAAMETHDRLTADAMGSHGGAIVKHTGDGVFAAFASSLRSVEAAWALDRSIANQDWSPLPSFAVRIGLHTGEAEQRGGDYFGSAVSRAARVMGHAGPGEILVSGTTADLVKDRLGALSLIDLGTRELRGFAVPERLARVVASGTDGGLSPSIGHARRATWVAVLPFRMLGGDDWLAEAFTDEVIGGLGRWRSLRVIGRTSMAPYANTELTVPEIARELDVRFVLEGSVRTAGSRMRVGARLLDGRTGAQVWSERFEAEFEDVFDVQDRIVHKIVGALDPAIRSAEGSDTMGRRAEDLSAWETVQRAWVEIDRFRPEGFAAAVEMLERVVVDNPALATAYSALSLARSFRAWLRMTDDIAGEGRAAVSAAREAVRIDPHDARSHLAAGWAAYCVGDLEAAKRSCLRAIELNPSMGPAYAVAGGAIAHGGDPAAGIVLFDQSIQLTPNDPGINWFYGGRSIAHFMMGDLDAVIADAERALEVRSGYLLARVTLTAALVEKGDLDRARREMRSILAIDPAFSMTYLDPYSMPDTDRERFRGALVAAGLESQDPADG